MTARDYKPGTVAVVRANFYDGVNEYRAFKDDKGWSSLDPNIGWIEDSRVTDVRPLVVLDPDSIPPLRDYLPESIQDYDADDHRLAALIAEIEAQTKPPKPPEPTGLGAVVEDAEGKPYVRITSGTVKYDWRDEQDCAYCWREVDAVRILSPGVQP